VVLVVVLKQDNMKYEENVSEISEEIQNKAIEDANKALVHYHRKIEREVHEKTKTIMYKVMDTETNEVIREFPPKKIQDMIAKMWELAGLFVDEKA
jgi:flagellar protein FlaG